MKVRTKLAAGAIAATAMMAFAPGANAHHGKDFLMTETDDMPQAGHVYGLLSSDTNVDKDGSRSTEITPGLLFAVGDHIALEPHFHVTKTSDEDWHYDATALAVRYSAGTMPGSEWRFALSGEVEKPKHSEEATVGTGRLIFVRTYPTSLVAINLIADHDFVSGGDTAYTFGLGVLKPVGNGDNVGVEVSARLPFSDGVEIVPGYYRALGGGTTVKLGVGVFRSDTTTSGTLHVQCIKRF